MDDVDLIFIRDLAVAPSNSPTQTDSYHLCFGPRGFTVFIIIKYMKKNSSRFSRLTQLSHLVLSLAEAL